MENMSAQSSLATFEPTARQSLPPLSLRLWDLDWNRHLPLQLDEGVSVEFGTFDKALPFMQEHYGEIFGTPESLFLVEPMTEAKRRFCAEMDSFLFRAEGRTVGILLAHPTDWSTYYVRTTAFVEEYRGRGFMRMFLVHFWAALRAAGVARVESEASPANIPVLSLQMKEGFVVTSAGSSERWGATVRLTKFLSPEPENVFRRQFCSMPTRTTAFEPKPDRSRS
jgi:GNAT superfamily N-acetyltransferase